MNFNYTILYIQILVISNNDRHAQLARQIGGDVSIMLLIKPRHVCVLKTHVFLHFVSLFFLNNNVD